jgi:hypothetical protein
VAAAAGGPAVNGGLASGDQLTLAQLRGVVFPARRHSLRYGRIAAIGLVYKPVFMRLQLDYQAGVLARRRAAAGRRGCGCCGGCEPG